MVRLEVVNLLLEQENPEFLADKLDNIHGFIQTGDVAGVSTTERQNGGGADTQVCGDEHDDR